MYVKTRKSIEQNDDELKEIRKKNLKKLISDKNMTQKEFAEKLGYSPEHINALINGRLPVSYRFAQKVVSVFPEARIGWLLGNEKFETTEILIKDKMHKIVDCFSSLYTILDFSAESIGYHFDHLFDKKITEVVVAEAGESKEDMDGVVCLTLEIKDGISIEITQGELDNLFSDIVRYTAYLIEKLISTKNETWYPFKITSEMLENG